MLKIMIFYSIILLLPAPDFNCTLSKNTPANLCVRHNAKGGSMEVTVKDIIRCLLDFSGKIELLNHPLAPVSPPRLLTDNTVFKTGSVYLGSGRRLKGTDFRNLNLTIIYTGQSLEKDDIRGTQNLNLFHLENFQHTMLLFNQLLDLFEERKDSSAYLSDTLIYGKGLQHILDIGKELLLNPLLLVTGEGKLVAKATDLTFYDPLCEELFKTGKFSKKTLDFMNHGHPFNNASLFSPPFLYEKDDLRYRRIVCPVKIQKNSFVSLVVIESLRKFQHKDRGIIQELAKAIEWEAKQSTFYQDLNDTICETLVKDLLDHTITTEKELSDRLSSISWNPGGFYLLLIATSSESGTYLAFYREMFKRELRERVLIFKNYLLILLEHTDMKSLRNNQRFLKILSENDMKCGISNYASGGSLR